MQYCSALFLPSVSLFVPKNVSEVEQWNISVLKKKKKNRKKRCNQIYKVKSPSILEEVKRKKIPSDTEINIIALL